MKRTVTDREKTILFALAAGFLRSWTNAFILSRQESEEAAGKLKSLNSSVQHWKNHPEIKKAYEEAAAILEARDRKTADGIIKEIQKEKEGGGSERTETNSRRPLSGKVDYTDPANQARKLNELVNQADDAGEALDALKVIIQTQKADRDAAREGKKVVFYTPLRCHECPLYAKQLKKAGK